MPRSRAPAGIFQCDCRGVGADWEVGELRGIATALLGTVDLIPSPTQMADEFEAMMRAVDGPRGRDARRCGCGRRRVRRCCSCGRSRRPSRTSPPRRQDVNPLTAGYPTGAWGDESRDYHVAVRLPAKPIGAEQLAARVQLAVGDAGRGPGAGQGAVVGRRRADHPDQPGGRALHRAGRAGRGDPGGTGGQGRRRRRGRRPSSSAARSSSRRRPATRRRPRDCARSSTSTTPARARCD